jgi:DNA topoisomerase I
VSGMPVTLRNGPYGLYVQLGEAVLKTKETPAVKPKRQSLLKGMTPDDVTLDKALALLSLPRELGPHPENQEAVLAGVGRFGPYVKHGTKYKSIPADESVLDIGMNRAVALLAEAKGAARGRAAARPVRIVGNHPDDAAPIELYDGRYGPYVKHGGVNATVPRDLKPEELTVEQAVALLAERTAKGGSKKPSRTRKTAPVPANDAGEKPKARRAATKKAPAKGKAAKAKAAKPKAAKPKADVPRRTGTDG